MLNKVIRSLVVVFGLLGSLTMVQAPSALAAGIVVNTTSDNSSAGDGQCSLREAIKNTNADKDISLGDCAAGTGNDTITFSVSGTLTLAKVLPTVKMPLSIQGPGPVLDGGGDHSILIVNAPSGAVTVKSLNFQNAVCNSSRNGGGAITNLTRLRIYGGVFSNNDANNCDGGGAIRNEGVLRLYGVQFSGNTGDSGSGSGGAILNKNVLSVFNNNKFLNNQAYNGGAVANLPDATVSVNQAIFRNNSGWGYGGAIYSQGAVYVDLATFDENDTGASGYGGGIAVLAGTANVANSTISDGWAKRGGALYMENGTVNLTGDTLVNNRGWGGGGAIYQTGPYETGSNLTITNSTLTQNSTAGEYAGAIWTEYSFLHVVNSTLAANTCVCPQNYGSGGIASEQSYVMLSNAILANYWGNGNNYDCSGEEFVADSHNLAYDYACDQATVVTPYTLLLGKLLDHGGPTQTMRPGGSSAALDAGDDGVCQAAVGDPNYGAGGVDQRGTTRPQGQHCDVGAYEVRGQ
jgi:CSLREA domain-containing protein